MPVIQITISQGRSIEQKRELGEVMTRETARIMKTEEEKVRILIYEVSKENWGNAGILILFFSYKLGPCLGCQALRHWDQAWS
jgi:4-oxalocrotonate tautomerase